MLKDNVEQVRETSSEEEIQALEQLQEELAESEETRSEVQLARRLSEFIEDGLESEVTFIDQVGEPDGEFETVLVRFEILRDQHPGSLDGIFDKFFTLAGRKLIELIEEVGSRVKMKRPNYDQNDVTDGILHTVQVNEFVPVQVSQQHFAAENKTVITTTVLLGAV